MAVELFQHLGQVCVFWLFWMDRDSAQGVPFFLGRSGNVSYPRDKGHLLHIWCSEYYGELRVVNPSFFPVNPGLGCCEPWVSEDYFVFSEVG